MSLETDFMSVHDAAIMLKVDRSRVKLLCRQGRFAGATKIARNWIIPREAVENFKRLPPGGRYGAKQQRKDDEALVARTLEELKAGETNGEWRYTRVDADIE